MLLSEGSLGPTSCELGPTLHPVLLPVYRDPTSVPVPVPSKQVALCPRGHVPFNQECYWSVTSWESSGITGVVCVKNLKTSQAKTLRCVKTSASTDLKMW